ncbi:hypothetical protein ACGF1Z_13415 [Streptomyces sp. NPDC048018]|uniref:hypothetical protein n=1 Tax=Streptomyces sp. NPDC048018 TaxID=3365499 RepID=UPI00371CD069
MPRKTRGHGARRLQQQPKSPPRSTPQTPPRTPPQAQLRIRPTRRNAPDEAELPARPVAPPFPAHWMNGPPRRPVHTVRVSAAFL